MFGLQSVFGDGMSADQASKASFRLARPGRFCFRFPLAGMIPLALLSVSIHLTPTAVAAAGDVNFRIKRFTPDEGLPHNSVESLLQTRDGWL